MIPDSSAAPSQRSALGLPGVLWRVRGLVYAVVFVIALAAPGATSGDRLQLALFMLAAGLLPLAVAAVRPGWILEVAALVDLLAGFVLWWQIPGAVAAGLAMTMWAVVLVAVGTRPHIEDVLLRVAIALEVAKVLLALVGPQRPVAAGMSAMFRPPFDEMLYALAQMGLVLGVSFAVRALVATQRTQRGRTAGDEDRYGILVEESPAAILVAAAGTVVYANGAAVRMLGVPSDDVIGSDLFGVIPEELVPGYRTAIRKAVADGEAVTVVGPAATGDDGATLRIGLQIAPTTYDGEAAVQLIVDERAESTPVAEPGRHSDDRFRTAFFYSPAAIVLLDLSGSVESINPAASELLGYAPDGLIGTNWQAMVGPDDVRALAAFAAQALGGDGDHLSREIRFLTSDGRLTPAKVSVVLIRDGASEPVAFVAQLHDLTERYTVENALRESEKRYRNLFERIPVALYRTTPEGGIVDVNPALLELMGYDDVDTFRHRRAHDVYVDDADRARIARQMSEEGHAVSDEVELRRADGSTFWARDTARTVVDGRAEYFEGAIVDVTERHLGEERLRAQARRQEALAHLGQRALDTAELPRLYDDTVRIISDALGLGLAAVVLVAADGSLDVAASRGWPGSDRPEVRSRLEGLGRRAVAADRPILVRAVAGEIEDADPESSNGLAIAIGGSGRVFGALIALGAESREFAVDQVHFLVSTTTVLTAAFERAIAADQLEQLVRSKDEFVASISHELRTPLTVVTGMAEELQEHWQEFTIEEVNDFLGHVVAESRDMQDLIEDLLVAARADIGKVTVSPEAVVVRDAVEGVVAGLTLRPEQHCSVGGDSEVADADPVRLRQILRNLISNAVRYGGDQVEVGIGRENGHVHVTVTDDGPGIPDGKWEQVFEPYGRAHEASAQPSSVGLGLTVSRKLARLMGGDLAYRYEGRSIFDLTLPAAGMISAGGGGDDGAVQGVEPGPSAVPDVHQQDPAVSAQ